MATRWLLGAVLGLLLPISAPAQQGALDETAKKARIEGSVFSKAEGTPLSAASIRLRKVEEGFAGVPDPNEAAYSGQTGADGRYVFDGVEPGTYRIFADQPGYVRRFYGARGITTMSPGTAVQVAAGQTVKGLDVEMFRQGTISGSLKDEDGEPVRQAHVIGMRVWYEDGRREMLPLASADTDVNGGFALRSLLPGRYYLCAEEKLPPRIAGASVPGQREAVETMLRRTYYPDAVSPQDALALEVGAGSTLEGIELRMKRAKMFRVKGKVDWGADGPPERPLVLALIPKAYDMLAPTGHRLARAQKDGVFTFEEVAEGSYYVEPARVMVDPGSNRKIGARGEVVVRDLDVSDVRLRAVRTPDLTGIVRIEGPRTNEGGSSGAPGAAQPGGNTPKGAPGGSASRGKGVAPPPPPGYTPESPAPGAAALPGASAAPGTTAAPTAAATQVDGADAGSVVAPLAAVQPESESLAGVGIRLNAAERLPLNPPKTTTDPDGSFFLPSVPLDRYRVETANLPEGAYVKAVFFNGQDVTNWMVDLIGGTGGRLEVILSRDAGEVSGAVRDAKGNAVRAAWVSVWSTDRDESGRAKAAQVTLTDSRGAFRVGHLAPGKYKVVAWEEIEYGLAQTIDFCRLFESDGVTVKLDERGRETVELRPISGAKVEEAGWRLP